MRAATFLRRLFGLRAKPAPMTPHQRGAITRRERQSARTWAHIEALRADIARRRGE